ncbi:MAG: hypothetical protein JO244_07350 [Solirubrobacterales bacterium]|nr:hypothetical protein [Solirubrobacterales bacterium]
MRLVLRPIGYLVFVIALGALSATAWLLGERNELGFFSGRLARTMWGYREITRRGVQVAWLVWALLLGLAVSPLDPLTSRWDEVGLVAVALAVLWRRFFVGRQAER